MTCPECDKRPVATRGYCNPCYKRLLWRPQGGAAVQRERAASLAWKNAHREENRARDRAFGRARRAA